MGGRIPGVALTINLIDSHARALSTKQIEPVLQFLTVGDAQITYSQFFGLPFTASQYCFGKVFPV